MASRKKAEDTETTEDYTFVPVWEGGFGELKYRTIARNEAEALNNICEKNPTLLAIGCYAERMTDVDGCEVVAVVPPDYQYRDDRRSRVIEG
ncbi:MAG: hypothetical protein GT601_17615 [Acidaminobacter sp.]|uniref:hypothetical protein n=1 Tax=Acidaminobacter sp. TaxID=1872102 RepID=UPI00137F2C52|nr:hypothetical protein [Acidaminobacter sp.]MZQ99488.1 hypothetical protein [Acidaminobacter sp.]